MRMKKYKTFLLSIFFIIGFLSFTNPVLGFQCSCGGYGGGGTWSCEDTWVSCGWPPVCPGSAPSGTCSDYCCADSELPGSTPTPTPTPQATPNNIVLSGVTYCQRPDGLGNRRWSNVPIIDRNNNQISTSNAEGNWTSGPNTPGYWSNTVTNVKPNGIALGFPEFANASQYNSIPTACLHSDILGIIFPPDYASLTETGFCGRAGVPLNSLIFNLGYCPVTTVPGADCNDFCTPDEHNNPCPTNQACIPVGSDEYRCRLATNPTDEQCLPLNSDPTPTPTATATATPTSTPLGTCGDGIPLNSVGEECDLGAGNGAQSVCSLDCKNQRELRGSLRVGEATAQQIPGTGYTVCEENGSGSTPITGVSGQVTLYSNTSPSIPGNTPVTINTSDGSFSTWIKVGTSGTMPSVRVTAPYNFGSNVLTCPSTPPVTQQTVPRDYTEVNFYYSAAAPNSNPWWQLQGGLLYSGNSLVTRIPGTCDENLTDCLPYLMTQLLPDDLGLFSAGIPWAAGNITTEAGDFTQRNELPGTTSQAIRGDNVAQNIVVEGYDYFASKLDLENNGTVISNNSINTKPTCTEVDGVSLCKKTGDLTISNNSSTNQFINVAANEKIVIIVDGSITFSDVIVFNEDQIVNVAEGGFIAFIASEEIIFNGGVGNQNYNDDANVEGVFIANTIIVEDDSDPVASGRRFKGEGTFVAQNELILRRNLAGQGGSADNNNEYSSELFTYRPDFLLNFPESLKSYTLERQEVN